MKKITILGVGSPLGQDCLGWLVIEQLLARHHINLQRVHLEALDRPGVSLLDKMVGIERGIIVDAICSGAPLGTLHCFSKETVIQSHKLFSTHELGLAETLILGERLHLLPKELSIYGLEVAPEHSTLQEPLWTERELEPLLLKIEEQVAAWV